MSENKNAMNDVLDALKHEYVMTVCKTTCFVGMQIHSDRNARVVGFLPDRVY